MFQSLQAAFQKAVFRDVRRNLKDAMDDERGEAVGKGPGGACGAAHVRRIGGAGEHFGHCGPEFSEGALACSLKRRYHFAGEKLRAEHELVERRIGAGEAEIDEGRLAQRLGAWPMSVASGQRDGQFIETLGGQMTDQFGPVGIMVIGSGRADADALGNRAQREFHRPHFLEHGACRTDQLGSQVADMIGVARSIGGLGHGLRQRWMRKRFNPSTDKYLDDVKIGL